MQALLVSSWLPPFSTPLHNGSLSCMSKGFHHPGIALHADCTTNLPKLITKTVLLKIMNVGENWIITMIENIIAKNEEYKQKGEPVISVISISCGFDADKKDFDNNY